MEKCKWHYVLVLALFSLIALTFRPGLWLVHKPANTEDVRYVKGWEDGCISGTNSYSLLFAPLLDKPFVKEVEKLPGADKSPAASDGNYKSAWSEGFTLCRYYQSSVYELMQFSVIVITLLFIGLQMNRKRGGCHS